MAFGSLNDRQDSDMADMNVTPLVDVMLVLLIIFMIAMPVFTSSIHIELPKSSIQAPPQEKQIIRVTVDAEGKYYINDTGYDLEGLRLALENMEKEQPNSVIAVRADKQTDYQFIASLLEIAKKAGIGKVGFVTELVEDKTNP